jgi:hypothetical protein
MSGSDGTAKYSYNFDVQESGEEESGEEHEDEDDEMGYGDEDNA